jgi:hypothetical protein
MFHWHPRPERFASIATLVAIALSLQACDISVPKHTIGNWESKTSYLETFEYVPPGASKDQGVLNSCSTNRAGMAGQCSGHGVCHEWYNTVIANKATHRLSFCKCDTYWAGPECLAQRRSQAVAYMLAIFGGMFGADQFYLGFYLVGTIKLVLLGSVAIMLWFTPFGTEPHVGRIIAMTIAAAWYVIDVVKVGSTQLYTANNFKLANDVPQAAFYLSILGFTAFLGFAIGIHTIQHQRAFKSRELLLLLAESKAGEIKSGPGLYGSQSTAPQRKSFTGYGTTLRP